MLNLCVGEWRLATNSPTSGTNENPISKDDVAIMQSNTAIAHFAKLMPSRLRGNRAI
jgi:hypothetical protein